MNEPCYIYVIGRKEGPVKVGISSYPTGRLGQIQTGCHFRCELLHIRKCRDRAHALHHEEIFHACHTDERLAGEWFELDATLAIESVDNGFEFEEHFAQEAQREYRAAVLNIWQLEDGSHPHH